LHKTGIPLRYKGCMLSLVALAMAAFLFFHFTMIWVYGKFYIYESNVWILVAETTMIAGILAFSSYCLVEYLRQEK
jgi:hypothetical protein